MAYNNRVARRKRNIEIDKISALPDCILHEILSYLPWKQAARTKVLSRRWHQAWDAFPILDFTHVFSPTLSGQQNKKLIKIVDNSMERFVKQRVCMERFKIRIILDSPTSDPLMNKWIGYAVDGLVQELDLDFGIGTEQMNYTLPRKVFGAASLTALTLRCCKFDEPSSLNLASLKKLSLRCIKLTDRALRCLLDGCTNVEELGIGKCQGLEKLDISGMHNLKSVKVDKMIVQQVYIEAPNLEKLCYEDVSRPVVKDIYRFWVDADHVRAQQPKPPLLQVVSSSLKDVKFESNDITDEFLNSFMEKFERLKRLELSHCGNVKKLKINSCWLSKLMIKYCIRLVEVDIDAPNLEDLRYEGDMLSHFAQTSPACKAQIFINGVPSSDAWRNLLSNSVRFKDLELRVDFSNFSDKRLRVSSFHQKDRLPKFSSWRVENLELLVWSQPLHPEIISDFIRSFKPEAKCSWRQI